MSVVEYDEQPITGRVADLTSLGGDGGVEDRVVMAEDRRPLIAGFTCHPRRALDVCQEHRGDPFTRPRHG